jgi:hypothetical protein
LDAKRKVLYHGILKRHKDTIEKTFLIEGGIKEVIVPYDTAYQFEKFYFTRK